MPYDYSQLYRDEELNTTWRDIYDDDISLPDNLLSILKRTVFLPQDFYDVTAAYLLLPSALCRIVPYLFLYGQSGSGKVPWLNWLAICMGLISIALVILLLG